MDEAAGATTAVDTGTSENPAPLTLKGGAVFLGPGEGGGALLSNPNGNNGRFLDLGSNFAFAATNGFTYTAWVRVDAIHALHGGSGHIFYLNDEGGGDANLINLNHFGTTRRAWLRIKNGSGKYMEVFTPSGGTFGDGNDDLKFFPGASGVWIHVVWTISPGGVWTLFRDGASRNEWTWDATATNNVVLNSNSITYKYAALGRDNRWGDGYFDGALRDVRIYDEALTADEIADLSTCDGQSFPEGACDCAGNVDARRRWRVHYRRGAQLLICTSPHLLYRIVWTSAAAPRRWTRAARATMTRATTARARRTSSTRAACAAAPASLQASAIAPGT